MLGWKIRDWTNHQPINLCGNGSQKNAESLLQTFQIEAVPRYQNEARPPKNEPYEPRNDDYDSPSPF